MNTVERAAKEVENRQAALNKLVKEHEAVAAALPPLREARAKAVRAFAAGETKQRETASQLDEQIKTEQLRLDGLDGLIEEARSDLETAMEELRQAQADQEKKFAAFVYEREGQRFKNIVAGLPGRLDTIYDKYVDLCRELAQLQIDTFLFEGFDAQRVLADFGRDLRMFIDERLAKGKFRRVAAREQLSLPASPMIAVRPEIERAIIGNGSSLSGLLNARSIADIHNIERREPLMKEFLEQTNK